MLFSNSINNILTCAEKSSSRQEKNQRTMRHSFNPITQTVIQLHSNTCCPTLNHWCRNTILQSVTLKRVDQMLTLPVPSKIANNISKIGLSDFLIDPASLNGSNHLNRTYPATCLFDNSKVILKIQPSGSQINTSHPSFLASFEEGEYQCSIYQKTENLQDIIEACKQNGTRISDEVSWKVVCEFCRWVLINASGFSGKLSTAVINFTCDGRIFFDLTESQPDEQDITALNMGTPLPVYEAPEILTRNNPDEQAFVWSLGCVVYEMLALEPAYFDSDGSNPFAVYMKIIQGELPPDILRGGQALMDLVWLCLVVDPTGRPTIKDILNMAELKVG
ncbi:serine/threonine-protein kinase Nek6-like [Haliotis cracherodii]|uniref:serine/threonine-protein kinase Nek6-like n=1 Tax=Haliotis cracherodii TaxID=6455 RepID=UPI0039E8BC31